MMALFDQKQGSSILYMPAGQAALRARLRNFHKALYLSILIPSQCYFLLHKERQHILAYICCQESHGPRVFA